MTEEELLRVIEQAASEGVTELDLSGNNLTTLPPEIGKRRVSSNGTEMYAKPRKLIGITF